MRIKAMMTRILNQIGHDKRTVALVLIAPIVILSLVYFIFQSTDTGDYTLGIINAPTQLSSELKGNENYNITLKNYDTKDLAIRAIKDETIIAAVDAKEDLSNIKIYLDGTNSSDGTKVKALISQAAAETMKIRMNEKLAALSKISNLEIKNVESEIKTNYIYGNGDNNLFDNFGAPLIGIIIFFFVFLISGINFLNERTSGTLEKLLSTPIRRMEIILGYVFGFGVLAVLQSIVISVFVVYVLNLTMLGSIGYVLMINLLTAMCALTLGMLLSTLASSEFQMLQFVPIVILPQVFLCGLFKLPGAWDIVGHFMPLYYTTDALTEVMLRGNGIKDIGLDCAIIALYAIMFMTLNINFLKRQRKI